MNELKSTQTELFSFFQFESVSADVSEWFCLACKQIIEAFSTILAFHFKDKDYMHVNSLS